MGEGGGAIDRHVDDDYSQIFDKYLNAKTLVWISQKNIGPNI